MLTIELHAMLADTNNGPGRRIAQFWRAVAARGRVRPPSGVTILSSRNSTPPQRIHVFRDLATGRDITIRHEHSITGITHAPVPATQLSRFASANHMDWVYTRDRMPCKKMVGTAGNSL